MQPMASIALKAARKAGDFILRAMDRPDHLKVETKARNDFVSNVDKTSEQIILEQIRETYPDHSILAEESGKETKTGEFTWIIDPLDGTLNFLQGFPHFSISIAVMKDKTLEHGVIFDPLRAEEFVASRGYGAQLNGKRIRVSSRSKLTECVLGTGIPPSSISSRLDEYIRGLGQLTGKCRGIRRAGSAALDLAYVAAGRTDGFWEMGLSQWDTAAGIVLVREAGGFISDLEGGETYWDSGDICAANPKAWREIIKELRPSPS